MITIHIFELQIFKKVNDVFVNSIYEQKAITKCFYT